MNKQTKKILNIFTDILMFVIIFVAISVTVLSLTSDEKGVSRILGIIPFSVQSASMVPTINEGDLIVTRAYDGVTRLAVGDVICFYSFEENNTIIKTHRIREVIEDGAIISYATKGDANIAEDAFNVAPGDIVSVYNGFKIGGLGFIIDFFRSKIGFFMCIILPLLLFFAYQLYTFVSSAMLYSQEEAIANAHRRMKK